MACARLGLVGTATSQGRPGTLLPDGRRQTNRRLPLGAHRHLQELPCDSAPAQDALAVQEGEKTSRPDDAAECRQNGCRLRGAGGCTTAKGNVAQRKEA